MKTLVIAHKYPLPENSGDRIRTMNFARYFSNSGRVDILYFHPADRGVDIEFPFGRAIYVDKYEGTYGSTLSRLYEKMKYSKPWSVGGYTRKCVEEVVRIIERETYDVILCRYAHHAYPLMFLPEVVRRRIIVDIDDMISDSLYETMYGKKTALKSIKSRLDFAFLRSYQKKCASLGTSLVCSESDRKNLERHVKPEKLFVVPNVAPEVSFPQQYLRDGHCNLDTLLFVGNLEYEPNVQGLTWFIETIFAVLAKERDTLSLIVAGRNPTANLRQVCGRFERIRLIESPPSIVPFYEQCGVVVVPLLAGGGTRIKVLEAGTALRPVISTGIGAYGLGLREFEHLLYMSDYQTFIDRYQWLSCKDNYMNLVTTMHEHVAGNYSVGSFNRAVDSVMDVFNRG